MRLFIAIALPETIRWQLRLLAAGLAGIKWAPPENYHITLRFLGEVDGAALEDIDSALTALRAPAFPLRLAGIGHFGSGDRIRALWAGIEKSPALFHLQGKVESAMVRAGCEPLGQTYRPHVTLGTLGGAHRAAFSEARFQDYLAAHNLFRSDEFSVSHVTLFSSRLGGEHSHYDALQSYPLDRI